MSFLTETTDYDNFDPQAYIGDRGFSFGDEAEKKILLFNVDALHDIFHSGAVRGHNLLDVGTGPTIRTILSSCGHVDNIYLSDVNKQSRDLLNDWWKSEQTSEQELTDYVLKKENARNSIEERQQMMKTKIRGILPIDVRSGNPLGNGNHPLQFDVITTSLCLESASQTLEEYHKNVQNVASLLKVGGHLIVLGAFNIPHYDVGHFKFQCVPLSQNSIGQIYTECGFDIVKCTQTVVSEGGKWNPSSSSESFAMLAIKKK
ncbi:indolethylamine N-methyltransferase-like [Pecten maximus]|uniref:indolethylamine N-methyltransferase-like n=1 Tax=Pecten maximus TaxID=6579 RepID=UPI0014584CE7|nr:indolethylamine N-methyltransferase-like [Pecten maximus]